MGDICEAEIAGGTDANSRWPIVMTAAITEFWGKARPVADGTPAVHPLVAHCLDVAAVATLLPPRRGRSAVAGHHGVPPQLPERLREDVVCARCRDAARQFVDAMLEVFHPPAWAVPESDVVRTAWHLAGLTTLADWIGSRQEWFPYAPATDVAEPAAYFWGLALPRAAAALAAVGLAGSAPAPFGGLRRLFPSVRRLTPVQHWAETVPLPDGPALAIIEDLTGSGKTEAAVTLAHRLMTSGRAEGIYLALPTMATANAMFGRLADAYRALFAADARPSLALAHGRADLDARFTASITPDPRVPNSSHNPDPADEAAEAHCAAWLAADRRRALLAQVGVGTLDQALLAILPVWHAMLRLQGITRKVLIVDEAHAFDPYMREELATLLRFHAALGGSAVLLSATLPHRLRNRLVDAFRSGLGAGPGGLESQAYPLATMVGYECAVETECAPREGLPRRVTVTRLPDASEAVERIAAAERAGAAVVWVRNTVDDALAGVAALRQRGLDPLVFHARFAMQDRLKIEAEVLWRFGRTSDAAARRCVLVATQVVEQSLDIDFDLMVTDLPSQSR
jgi:CRISPR-associated endonuclease/helicase Cas3